MPGEEYITVKEYMNRFKMGYDNVMNLINTGQLPYYKTPSGKYRIKVGGDTVSKEMYELEKEKRIQAETKLDMLKSILNK